jgi:predicted TPR repeat methyltransferase
LSALQHSSGDLTADRRASYAEGLARDGDKAGAADLMAQALELVPDWTAGWSLLARYAQDAGDRDAAIAAWQEVADRDAAGVFGAPLALAALGIGSPVAAPRYVAALFDDYAARFETALVGSLRYKTPDMLVDALVASGFAQARLTYDLGCGTGLMGVALGARAGRLEGVDLSPRMLAEARGKGLYARLSEGDLVAFLSEAPGAADLIVAADVFNYVGPLDPVLAAAAARLAPGGRLAFSLERHDGPEPLIVGESLRFAHQTAAAEAAVSRAGLTLLSRTDCVLREDRGQPVAGVLLIATL